VRLPDRVYVHTDAYGEHLGVRLTPLPPGPRLMGEEAEFVRAGGVDDLDRLTIERDDYRDRWETLGRVARKMLDRQRAEIERLKREVDRLTEAST
jgi:hypothetical protein